MAWEEREAANRKRDAQADPDAAYENGNLLARRGAIDDAEASYRRADELGHGTAAANLGLLLERRGDTDGARDAYARADERGDALGALRLGVLLADQNRWEDAKAAFARAEERGGAPAFDLALALEHKPSKITGATQSTFANPVLVGAVTLLVALVGVFLAYIANRGLPFVPTRELKVDLANGSNLVPGDDVVSGGHRIGFLSSLKPVELQSGSVGAQLTLKLSQSERIPVDSSVEVRLRTVLGSKYIDLVEGSARHVYPDGGTLPVSQTQVPVQLDEIFNIFDAKTRSAIQTNLQGFGGAFTARGNDLNLTIQSLPSLLAHLQPVAAYLSAPSTELTRFLSSLDAFTGALAPVSAQTAALFRDAATTFQAITTNPSTYEATIAESPSTLAVSTDSLRTQQPFLVDFTTLGNKLSPATASLKAALPYINPALEAGARTLGRAPTLNAGLQRVMSSLKSLAQDPLTNVALNGLVDTVSTLNPMVRFLGPYETVCDYFNYSFTNLADTVSEPTSFGTAQRAMFMSANPAQLNNVAAEPAAEPMNGGGTDLNPLGGNGYNHFTNYGAAVDNQGNADCEAGQRGYPRQLNYFDPLHRLWVTDAHVPGNQGPTFAGLSRVPPGETFSRNPQTGPQALSNPSNP